MPQILLWGKPPVSADKSDMQRAGLRLHRKVISIAIILTCLWPTLASALSAAKPDDPKSNPRRDAYLLSLAELPSPQLLAMARQARDEGRFQDAILLMETSLNSPWGVKNFNVLLKAALAEANRRLNQEAPDRMQRLMGIQAPPGDSFLLSLLDYEKNPTTREERIRLELQSYLVKPITEKVRTVLLKRAMNLLTEELKSRMPLNPLRYFETHQQYYIEGFFNSEYPGISTETNLELGLLHKSLQDYVQAEHYLGEALAKRSYLPVTGREFEARYALAEIYVVQGKLYQYEKTLQAITALDKPFISQEGAAARLREQIRTVLFTDPAGLDKVLQLYRLNDDFSLEAHRLLGAMYLQRQDFEQALMHLIFAVIKPVSRAMTEIRQRDYGYTFTTLTDFLREARDYPDIIEYLADSHLYEGLYNLALAAPGYQPNSFAVSRQLFQVLLAAPEAGPYQSVSQEKLRQLKR